MNKFIVFVCCLWLSSCLSLTEGPFTPNTNVFELLIVGQTAKDEVIKYLGSPTERRIVGDRDVFFYNFLSIRHKPFFATSDGSELVVRFENDVVAEVKIEATGTGLYSIWDAMLINPTPPWWASTDPIAPIPIKPGEYRHSIRGYLQPESMVVGQTTAAQTIILLGEPNSYREAGQTVFMEYGYKDYTLDLEFEQEILTNTTVLYYSKNKTYNNKHVITKSLLH